MSESEPEPEPDPYLDERITRIRPMTDDELAREGWQHAPEHHRPPVIVLTSGATIYPSCDPEGNRPGALFGEESDGTRVYFPGTTDE